MVAPIRFSVLIMYTVSCTPSESSTAPLAEKMPGLIKMEVSKVIGAPGGESDLHLIAEMYFESKDALLEALSSPEGRAAGKDLRGFAGPIISMHIAELV